MTVFIELREKIKAFYARYDIYILPVVKFALAMVIFIGINNMLGYLTILNNLFVVAVLALICAILPLNGTVVIGVFMIVLHCFGVGLEVGGFALLMYLLMLLLYFRFVPGDALALLMSPLAFAFNIPGTVPLALGLLRGPVSAISGAFGVVSWYFVKMVDGIAEMKSIGDASLLDVLKEMLDRLEISAKQRMKHMSKGTREKVQLILAMSRQAKLYLLDEPIGGVDPAARDYILDTIIRDYNPEASVIISTHLIADVEKVLDEVLFIDRGQILLQSSVDAIREEKGMSVDALFREVYKC